LSTEKPSCGGGPVAKSAQAEIRISVERSILRRQEFEEEQAQEDEWRKLLKGRSPLSFSQNQQIEIRLGRTGIIPDHQIWGEMHGELTERCFGISKFRAF
jgi:hypothetical protein